MSQTILVMLALFLGGLALDVGRSGASEKFHFDDTGAAEINAAAAYTDGTAYVVQRTHGPRLFMQPAPVAIPVLHGSESREYVHLALDTRPDSTGWTLYTHLAGPRPASETAGLANDGRHRHRWIETYRC